MNFYEHTLCTHVLNPAEGDESGTRPLPVARHLTADGYAAVSSFWRLTTADLAALQRGGVVMLTFLGRTCPPVMLQVVPDDKAPHTEG